MGQEAPSSAPPRVPLGHRAVRGISVPGLSKFLKGATVPAGTLTPTQVASLIRVGALEPMDTVPDSGGD